MLREILKKICMFLLLSTKKVILKDYCNLWVFTAMIFDKIDFILKICLIEKKKMYSSKTLK